MNPIYKFELTAGNTTQRAYPIYGDALSKDFEKESGQEFFRAKLSGKLSFESDDYTFIVSQAFDTQFILEIFISYNAGQLWASYWRGTFWKTDCEFDGDAKTVVVQPTVLDQYNDVLAGMDKEYNLIDLAPEIVPVEADKRPMVQVYVPGQSVIGCFLSGMWWEQECEPESDETKLVNDFKFALNKKQRILDITQTGGPALPDFAMGAPDGYSLFDITTDGYRFRAYYDETTDPENPFYAWEIVRISDNVQMWFYKTYAVLPNMPYSVTLSAVDGTGATGNVTLYVHDMAVYSRYVCDTLQINGINTYEISADDIVENNRNYHRVIGYYFPDTIYFSSMLTTTPNQWGLYQPGQYYQPPYLYWNPELFPVARSAWGRVSIWFTFSTFDWIVEESGRSSFTIKHAYPIWSVISVLLEQIAPGITHEATTDYSQFLYGTNLIGITQTLLITPKSNIVSAGYDQPAQKAPITLKNVLDMLRDCFRCYWFIDEQNRFRVEHIQYFRNGGSYSDLPVVGIDLTTKEVTRTGKKWAFARDQYKFDKPAMAARYQFGWMDDVTQLFDGFPIDIISKYVNPDNIEQIDISRFTSDIDYILLNPGAVSKDGFVLLSAIQVQENIMDYSDLVNGAGYLSNGYVYSNPSYENRYGTIRIPWGQNDEMIVKTVYTDTDFYCVQFDDNGNFIQGSQENGIMGTHVFNRYPNAAYIGVTLDLSVGIGEQKASYGNSFASITKLPYYNYQINGNDHYLQNAYVAFCFLQQYYDYDMPAPLYSINGEQKQAQGTKKLKNQTIRFPALVDPNLFKLVKTNLGDGVIEKLSLNLSSRNANATLKYDTE